MSPGWAPLMKNGPVCGLPGVATRDPRASRPAASAVEVTTVSPGSIRSTGGCEPIVE